MEDPRRRRRLRRAGRSRAWAGGRLTWSSGGATATSPLSSGGASSPPLSGYASGVSGLAAPPLSAAAGAGAGEGLTSGIDRGRRRPHERISRCGAAARARWRRRCRDRTSLLMSHRMAATSSCSVSAASSMGGRRAGGSVFGGCGIGRRRRDVGGRASGLLPGLPSAPRPCGLIGAGERRGATWRRGRGDWVAAGRMTRRALPTGTDSRRVVLLLVAGARGGHAASSFPFPSPLLSSPCWGFWGFPRFLGFVSSFFLVALFSSRPGFIRRQSCFSCGKAFFYSSHTVTFDPVFYFVSSFQIIRIYICVFTL
jgi:hypothetical protein